MKKAIFILFTFFTLAGFSQVTNELTKEVKDQIIINHEITQKVLTEFVDGAEYYKINYLPVLKEIKSIRVVSGDNTWVTNNINGEITLNERLLQYPNLMRIHILQEIGKLGGLKSPKKEIRVIMWPGWELNPRFEFYADVLRQRGVQREKYFLSWKEVHPIAQN